eukprot:171113-Ditylum_brightwellii.AAC.1
MFTYVDCHVEILPTESSSAVEHNQAHWLSSWVRCPLLIRIDTARGGRKPAIAMSQGVQSVHFGARDTTDPTNPDLKHFIAPASTRLHRGINSDDYIRRLPRWNTSDQK